MFKFRITKDRLSKVEKRKMLGAFLILSFVTYGALIVSDYLVDINVDTRQAAIVSISIGGILAIYIEVRKAYNTPKKRKKRSKR